MKINSREERLSHFGPLAVPAFAPQSAVFDSCPHEEQQPHAGAPLPFKLLKFFQRRVAIKMAESPTTSPTAISCHIMFFLELFHTPSFSSDPIECTKNAMQYAKVVV
jgi:hypothetical protein